MAWYNHYTEAELEFLMSKAKTALENALDRGVEVSAEGRRKRKAEVDKLQALVEKYGDALSKKQDGGIKTGRITASMGD